MDGAWKAGAAAGHAVGTLGAVLGQDGERHGRQEGELAHGAVAAAVRARAAASRADAEALHAHGVAVLHHLGLEVGRGIEQRHDRAAERRSPISRRFATGTTRLCRPGSAP